MYEKMQISILKLSEELGKCGREKYSNYFCLDYQ